MKLSKAKEAFLKETDKFEKYSKEAIEIISKRKSSLEIVKNESLDLETGISSESQQIQTQLLSPQEYFWLIDVRNEMERQANFQNEVLQERAQELNHIHQLISWV